MDQPQKNSTIMEVFGILSQGSIWMKIEAIIGFIFCGLSTIFYLFSLFITKFSLIVLINLAIIGLTTYICYLVLKAAQSTDLAAQNGSVEDAKKAMTSLKMSFMLSCILIIATLVLVIITIIYIKNLIGNLMSSNMFNYGSNNPYMIQ